jgi:uncharacterized membrane protein YhaH (DUF805 family)
VGNTKPNKVLIFLISQLNLRLGWLKIMAMRYHDLNSYFYMLISEILTIASHQFYSFEKIFMIFNGILTFNGQTGKCCPIKVNPFHPKAKHCPGFCRGCCTPYVSNVKIL